MKNIAKIFLASALGGALTLGAYMAFFDQPEVRTVIESAPGSFVRTAMRPDVEAGEGFTQAAEKTVNSVVHVKTQVEAARRSPSSPFEYFFGQPPTSRQQPRIRQGSGSGVIVSSDGYIVTNNHVIENAQEISVSLNSGLEYTAEVVGTDPTTDIALIKVDADELPFLTFSNSDDVELGEWVLAVGNPFNLTSTVTAGIVSAKSRAIGIIEEQTAIESFIQTDAAVNPGNSGGALVNASGELIGINSAISTHTGSYEGYSFAVPSNIVKKVIEDLLEYGTVQRAFIGVSIADVTPRVAEEFDLEVSNGVYVNDVTPTGAARDAGIQSGDVIVAVNERQVTKSSQLQEIIGRKRPGDEVTVSVIRNGDRKEFDVELRNIRGTTEAIERDEAGPLAGLGATFSPLSDEQKEEYRVNGGVVVDEVVSGIFKEQGIPEGFVITHINRRRVMDVDDIESAIDAMDPVLIQGFTPEGKVKYYVFEY